MKYFHKAVGEYMKRFKQKGPQEELDTLADQVLSDVKHSLFPSKLQLKELGELHIKKRHGTVETEDTGMPHLNKEKLEKIYGTLICGKWSQHEVNILRGNWDTFCKNYHLDNPFWFIALKKREMKLGSKVLYRFKLYLSHGLQNRGLSSVYSKWESLFCTPKTGHFSEAELSLSRQLTCRCKEEDVCYILTLALQRKRRCILAKLKDLNHFVKRETVTVQWTMTLEGELVKSLVEELEATDIEDLSMTIVSWQWEAVAKKVGVTQKQAYDHWHHHLQPALMVHEWHTRGELHIMMIKKLRQMLEKGEVDDWRQVDWAALGQHLGGYSSLFVNRQMATLRWNYVTSKKIHENIQNIMQVLSEEALPNIKRQERQHKGCYLRRLVYDWTSQSLTELQPPEATDFVIEDSPYETD